MKHTTVTFFITRNVQYIVHYLFQFGTGFEIHKLYVRTYLGVAVVSADLVVPSMTSAALVSAEVAAPAAAACSSSVGRAVTKTIPASNKI